MTYEETAESHIKAGRCIAADRLLYGDHHPYIKPIQQVKLNELAGFAYLNGGNADAHFESAQGNHIHLNIYIGIRGSNSIEDVLACVAVKAFFADIKTEERR